jgi:uncharacterized membrane protein YkvA (DUF1232 family)
MSFVAPSYLAALRVFVDGYEGTCGRSILIAGDVFGFYSRLFSSDGLDREARGLVSAVLAYFVVPHDILPEEELGPYGLIDDLYVAAHVFRLLRRMLPRELLADAWHDDEPIERAFSRIYGECRSELGKRARLAIRLAGLS